MATRKSVCVKWTFILLVVSLCPFVHSRPQDTSLPSLTTNSVQLDKATENPIRYRFRQDESGFNELRLPIVIGFTNNSFVNGRFRSFSGKNYTISTNVNISDKTDFDRLNPVHNRQHRMITKTVVKGNGNHINGKRPNRRVDNKNKKNEELVTTSKKPVIRKVITKWTDKTKYEDFNFSPETSKSVEKEGDSVDFTNSLSLGDYSSTENIIDQSAPAEKRPFSYRPNKYHNKLNNHKIYRPEVETEEENLSVVHSNKVHIIEYPFPSVRPAYIFTTPQPTPIITNLGNPKPWSTHHNVNRKPTQKPIRKKPVKDKYNYHNNVNNYPQYGGGQFEVTTFQPSNAYTERIVIRPEEYSASDDCPTVFLTLNNTFQGQGKEACPDLNIAVNTNVVNKNVVVDSDEEDPDNLLPGAFGLPFGEDSDAEDGAAGNDYFESDEDASQEQEQAESASVEATGLSNYNAAIQSDSEEPLGGGSPNAALSGGKPGKPNDDDELSFSGIMSFFKPAINALTWLAAINPFSFTIISMLLTPLAMLLAGYSGVAALFAPLGLARKASPKVIHVYRPQWEWDDRYKTWHLNSFPDNRKWRPPRLSRSSKEDDTDTTVESDQTSLFVKVKNWMKNFTKILRQKQKNRVTASEIRKNKRKKRETWTRRIK